MTAIERAEKFFQRIHYWAGEPGQGRSAYDCDHWDVTMLRCQLSVTRALIRQEAIRRMESYPKDWSYARIWGVREGLEIALDILNTVTGREK